MNVRKVMGFLKLTGAGLSGLFCFGCANIQHDLGIDLKGGDFVKRDMQISYLDKSFEGTAVLPRADEYSLKFEALGRLDLFTLQTCHRDVSEQVSGGLFSGKKEKSVQYKPSDIESDSVSCPVLVGGYEKRKGRHSWAFIDFEHPELTLPFKVQCNGSLEAARGVGVCQSRKGLIQRIKFEGPVLMSEKARCGVMTKVSDLVYDLRVKTGRCVWRFKEAAKEGREARLTVLGYDRVMIRGN